MKKPLLALPLSTFYRVGALLTYLLLYNKTKAGFANCRNTIITFFGKLILYIKKGSIWLSPSASNTLLKLLVQRSPIVIYQIQCINMKSQLACNYGNYGVKASNSWPTAIAFEAVFDNFLVVKSSYLFINKI
ncbi:MAG: hypothetical protein ABIN67_14700 [Ferruginibacter sp.]